MSEDKPTCQEPINAKRTCKRSPNEAGVYCWQHARNHEPINKPAAIPEPAKVPSEPAPLPSPSKTDRRSFLSGKGIRKVLDWLAGGIVYDTVKESLRSDAEEALFPTEPEIEPSLAPPDNTRVTQRPLKEPDHINNLGMEFILIQPGMFMMGSDTFESEKPVHRVDITKPFYMGKYPVTQAQWMKVMGDNPSHFKKSGNHPVENVTWNQVQQFLNTLNEGVAQYRLPTEAEWEYAARAGTTTAYSFGDNEKQLGDYAWYTENAGRQTHPVGEKRPNPWGLYDMHGNVWECVQDWYGKYPDISVTDPTGPGSGSYRVMRGGSWNNVAGLARSATRGINDPDDRFDSIGFRVLRTYP